MKTRWSFFIIDQWVRLAENYAQNSVCPKFLVCLVLSSSRSCSLISSQLHFWCQGNQKQSGRGERHWSYFCFRARRDSSAACTNFLDLSKVLSSFLTAPGNHWMFVTPRRASLRLQYQCTSLGSTTKVVSWTTVCWLQKSWLLIYPLFFAHRPSGWLEVCWRYIRQQHPWGKTIGQWSPWLRHITLEQNWN